MTHWDPNNLPCEGCRRCLMESIAEIDGEYVMWCPYCGTLLTANEFDPISASDWHPSEVVRSDLPLASRRYRPRHVKEPT